MPKVAMLIRVEPEDKRNWEASAKNEGLNLSQWVRRRCNMEVLFSSAPLAKHEMEHSVVTKREYYPERLNVPESLGGDLSKAISPRMTHYDNPEAPKKGKTCEHGIAKGYHCWQCQGIAKV